MADNMDDWVSDDMDDWVAGKTDAETEYGWEDYVRPLLEGASLGFSDEIGAGMATVPAMAYNLSEGTGKGVMDTYREIVAGIRGQQRQFAEDNPAYNIAANIAGGALTGGVGGARALATNVAKKAPPMAALAAVGAGEGALAGYGTSEEETYLGDLMETAKGSTIGAVSNPLVTKGAQKIGNIFRGSPQSKAGRLLKQSMDRDDITPQQLEDFLVEHPSSFPVDMPQGANLRGRGQAVTRTPGAGRRIAEEALETRQAGMEGRITQSLQEKTGGRFDVHGASAELDDALYKEASPFYTGAFTEANGRARRLNVTRNMMDIEDDPQYARAVTMAKRAFQRKHRIPPEGDEVEYWHQIKRGMDNEVGALKAKGEAGFAGDARARKNSLLSDMFEQVDDYKQANKIWSGGQDMSDALKDGRKVLLMDADLPKFDSMTDGEQKMFTNGAMRAILDKIEGGPSSANEARNLIKSTRFKKRMRNVFPKTTEGGKSYKLFVRDLEILAREGESRARLSPALQSITAGAQGDMGDTAASNLFGAGVDVMQGDVMNAAKGALRTVMPTNAGRNMPEAVSEDLGGLLFSNSVEAIQKALKSGQGLAPEQLQWLFSSGLMGAEASRGPGD